jgi:glutamine synthetase
METKSNFTKEKQMDNKEVLKRIKEDDVKFVSLQFTDVTGTVKSVDMPTSGVEGALEDGVWFDGSSVEGFARIQESDMRLLLDPETYAVLPWSLPERRRARIFCDILMPDGSPFEGDPRGVLKRQIARVTERGWTYNIGPEPEFFLFKGGGDNVHPVPHDVGGYFDFSAADDAVRVRTELMDALNSMGLDIEVGHHEVALGQHEIDFRFADAVKAADNVLTLKYTVKAIAALHGLTASFMPKPVFGINGSGMHCHQSLFDKDGNNVFFDDNDEYKLSSTAYSFIAGQLKHARGLAAASSMVTPRRISVPSSAMTAWRLSILSSGPLIRPLARQEGVVKNDSGYQHFNVSGHPKGVKGAATHQPALPQGIVMQQVSLGRLRAAERSAKP